MTLRFEVGWDTAAQGNQAVEVVEDPGGTADTFQVTVNTGKLCHTDLEAVLSAYDSFGGDLKAALDTASVKGWTYTVSKSVSDTSFTYTVKTADPPNEPFNLNFSNATTPADGTRLRQVLGFSGDQTGAGTYTSDVRPYYAILSTPLAKSEVTDDYEPEGVVEGDYSLGGSDYSIATATATIFHDFVVQFETKAQTYKRDATAAVPWTYQHMWEHARGHHPFLAVDDSESTIHRLRPEGGHFRPERAAADWDGAWMIPFRTYMLGRL